MSFSKNDYINTIKKIEIRGGHIIKHPNSDKIEINIIGVKMQKEDKQISLKSIYDLVIIKFDALRQDIEQLQIDVKEIKRDIEQLQIDMKEIKLLPTIVKEMKYNKLL